MRSHVDPREFELLARLEAEVRKLSGAQVTTGILGVIKEINGLRQIRARNAASQPQVKKWQL